VNKIDGTFKSLLNTGFYSLETKKTTFFAKHLIGSDRDVRTWHQ